MSPRVAITADRSTEGLADLSELPLIEPLESLPLVEALERVWETDAHLLMYHAVDQHGQPAYMRVNKRSPALGQIRKMGADLRVSVVVFDYDLPKSGGVKQRWASPTEVDAFLFKLEKACATGLPEPTVVYTTTHGARLVFDLTESVSPEHAEALMRWIFLRARERLIELDESCKDWSRLFRLPRVTREDTHQAQHEDPCFVLLIGDAKLDPKTIDVQAEAPPAYAATVPIASSGDEPDQDECREIMSSAWTKTAKIWLAGRDSYAVAFAHAAIDAKKGRDNEIMRLMGQAAGMLYGRQGASPEALFALFSEALDQLEPDAQTPDWRVKAWDIARRVWAAEASRHAAKAEVKGEAVREAKFEVWPTLLETMKSAYPRVAQMTADDEAARDFIRGRAIAGAAKGGLFLLQRDGSYADTPVTHDLLQAAIRHAGMDEVLATKEMRGKEMKPRSAQSLLDQYAIVVDRVEATPNTPHTRIVQRGSQRALVLKCHKLRKDLEPKRDADVEAWLVELGGEHHTDLTSWLSHSLEVGRAICGLLLVGASSGGKNMLVQGLAECFEDPHANSGDKATSKFNSGLTRNPVVHFEEGIPRGTDLGRAPDELLRALISGGDLELEPKGLATIHALIYPRVLISSNNIEIMSQICGRRDLTEDDLAAIGQRLLYIPVRERVSKWLREKGNYDFTRGWVAGDAENHYKLARHILWLHKNRKKSTTGDNRLLVEGSRDSRLMREYSTRTPVSRAVLRSLVQMMESPGNVRDGSRGVVIFDGEMYVIPSAIVDWYERCLQTNMRNVDVNPKTVGKVLRLVSLTKGEPEVRIVPGQPEGAARHRWWQIDLRAVLRESIAAGYTRTRLEEEFLKKHSKDELEYLMQATDNTRVYTSGTTKL